MITFYAFPRFPAWVSLIFLPKNFECLLANLFVSMLCDFFFFLNLQLLRVEKKRRRNSELGLKMILKAVKSRKKGLAIKKVLRHAQTVSVLPEIFQLSLQAIKNSTFSAIAVGEEESSVYLLPASI
jgi:hypothetical protein